MQEEYPVLLLPVMETASDWAALTYEEMGDSDYEVEKPKLPTAGALQISVRWALSGGNSETGLSMLLGNTQRSVYSAARDTFVHNASREQGARFGREYNGDGKCDFCPMLASRGAVYLTAESAGESTQFHDNCHCTISIERP